MGTCTTYRQDGCLKNQGQNSRIHPLEGLLGLQMSPPAIVACSCGLHMAGPPALGPPSSTRRWCWTRSQSLRTLSWSSMPRCVHRPAGPGLRSPMKPTPTASLQPAEVTARGAACPSRGLLPLPSVHPVLGVTLTCQPAPTHGEPHRQHVRGTGRCQFPEEGGGAAKAVVPFIPPHLFLEAPQLLSSPHFPGFFRTHPHHRHRKWGGGR